MSYWWRNPSKVVCPMSLSGEGKSPSKWTGRLDSHFSIPLLNICITNEHVYLSSVMAMIAVLHAAMVSDRLWGHLTMWMKCSLNRPHRGHLPSIWRSYLLRRFIVANRSNSSFNVVFCAPLILAPDLWRADQSTLSNVSFLTQRPEHAQTYVITSSRY